MAIITVVPCSYGQGYDGCEDQDEIRDYKDCLQLAHDPRHCRSKDSVAANTSQERAVDDSVGWGPIAVAGDNDDG